MTKPVLHRSPSFLPFVDRGDPANPDFVQADLTIDGAWHDLDLSGIVTETNISAVLLTTFVRSLNAGESLDFRRNGNVNAINVAPSPAIIGNIDNSVTLVVPCGRDRIVEYRVVGVWWKGILVTVMGWWRAA